MNIDQEVEIPVTTVETVITTTADDVPVIETTLEEVCIHIYMLISAVFTLCDVYVIQHYFTSHFVVLKLSVVMTSWAPRT